MDATKSILVKKSCDYINFCNMHPDQLVQMREAGVRFEKQLRMHLSTYLRSLFELSYLQSEIKRYDQIQTQDSCLLLLSLGKTPALLSIKNNIACALIEKSLGAIDLEDKDYESSRDFSSFEIDILIQTMKVFISSWSSALIPLVGAELQFKRIELLPQFIVEFENLEKVFSYAFKLRLDQVEADFSLSIPMSFLFESRDDLIWPSP